jgi:hypothetical protein
MIRKTGAHELGKPGLPIPFERLRGLIESIGIPTRMLGREAERRLRPIGDELVRWTLTHIAVITRSHGATPVFIALNNVKDASSKEFQALQDAKSAGFLVFNLIDLWQKQNKAALRVASWDEHANATGNRLIADRIFELIQQHRSALRLPSPVPQVHTHVSAPGKNVPFRRGQKT